MNIRYHKFMYAAKRHKKRGKNLDKEVQRARDTSCKNERN